MKFDILNRFSGAVQFSAELTCDADTLPSIKLGLAVKLAVKEKANLSGANLSDANLSDANLSGANLSRANLSRANLRLFKADMWMTLIQNRAEVSALIAALREGRVDGSHYQGDCACLVGTIANAKSVVYETIEHNSNNPAERWFMMISKGDKPGDDTGGGFAAGKALEWALEFCALSEIEIAKVEGKAP